MVNFHSPTGRFYSTWHSLSSRLLTHWTNGRGASVEAAATPVIKPLVLYEYNGCPFCQRVRAVISELDLDAQVYPTPRVTIKAYAKAGDSRYRHEVQEKSGQLMFPYMEDPNTGARMSDSGAIIAYLLETYGGGARARTFSSLPISKLMLRSLRLSLYFGMLRVPSRLPAEPLIFFGAQGNAGSIRVFDALTCLELPYLWKACARGSRKEAELAELAGSSARLCLKDPNTDFVSSVPTAIVRYLYKTYQTGSMPKEMILDYSTEGASSMHGTISSKAE
ncbi:glutathione S-transferase N-terminal domain-containing protein [Marinobacter sp. M-5]|uniref:glutathione S-transferase N-terminal domain-containing protein n=1 Tax=Marinobacter sp. M-5 TaxID=3081089 RepID=UPI00293CE7F8|nr:glutathione S-transferase N-terminal domain-containing protein [Marinobacter sp. M-5]MDV3504636.1 glutathione S-transferase N-terminal domain-containing protein [Marinobacter sp. M-5]